MSFVLHIVACHKLYNHDLNDSAQNKSWKLVGHLFKVGTLLKNIIGFPIGYVQ